jgi:hypothetical protein
MNFNDIIRNQLVKMQYDEIFMKHGLKADDFIDPQILVITPEYMIVRLYRDFPKIFKELDIKYEHEYIDLKFSRS